MKLKSLCLAVEFTSWSILGKGKLSLGRLCSSLWNQRSSSICHCSFLPLPRLLANLGIRLPWWNQLLIAFLLLQLLLCCTLVQIFSTSVVQVCFWVDVEMMLYNLPINFGHIFVFPDENILVCPQEGNHLLFLQSWECWSYLQYFCLISWDDLNFLLVFLTFRGWALVHWSPMHGSPQMLRQLGNTLLP